MTSKSNSKAEADKKRNVWNEMRPLLLKSSDVKFYYSINFKLSFD